MENDWKNEPLYLAEELSKWKVNRRRLSTRNFSPYYGRMNLKVFPIGVARVRNRDERVESRGKIAGSQFWYAYRFVRASGTRVGS